ncbi:MAG: outer membrane lipoprotein-sorting protein [Bacteroidota bacterium]
MKYLTYTLLLVAALLMAAPVFGQDAKEIIRKAEAKRRGIESSYSEMTMTIVRPTWKRETTMKSWSKGTEYALILITGPASQKGLATLKRGREVWNWVPQWQSTKKLPPSMMSQSWMDSDFTNEDLVQNISIIDDYDHQVLGEETVEGRKCWKIELIPHDDVPVVWSKVYSWVDQKDYLTLRSEFFDEDDFMVNIMKASNIKVMGGKVVASKLTMIPVEDEGHETIMEYNKLVFDQKIPESQFTIQMLKRIR